MCIFPWKRGLQIFCACEAESWLGVVNDAQIQVGKSFLEVWKLWQRVEEGGGEESFQASMKACSSLLLLKKKNQVMHFPTKGYSFIEKWSPFIWARTKFLP